MNKLSKLYLFGCFERIGRTLKIDKLKGNKNNKVIVCCIMKKYPQSTTMRLNTTTTQLLTSSFDSHIMGCTKRNKVSNHKNKFGFLSQKMLSEGSPNHRDILKTVMGSSWIARTILFEFIIFYSRYLNV